MYVPCKCGRLVPADPVKTDETVELVYRKHHPGKAHPGFDRASRAARKGAICPESETKIQQHEY